MQNMLQLAFVLMRCINVDHSTRVCSFRFNAKKNNCQLFSKNLIKPFTIINSLFTVQPLQNSFATERGVELYFCRNNKPNSHSECIAYVTG